MAEGGMEIDILLDQMVRAEIIFVIVSIHH